MKYIFHSLPFSSWLVWSFIWGILFGSIAIGVWCNAFFISHLDSWGIFIFGGCKENEWITNIMKIYTHSAGEEIILCISSGILLYLLIKKQWDTLVKALVLYAGGNALVHILFKPLFQRERPDSILITESDFSFPSGHTFAGILLLFLVWFLFRKHTPFSFPIFLIVGLLYSFLVAVSRLILHAHFLSDVLASIFLALFWSFFCFHFFFSSEQKK